MSNQDESAINLAASLEVNFLRWSNLLPAQPFEGARINGSNSNIFDIGGAVILKRRRLIRNSQDIGFIDIAAQGIMGSTLIHVAEFPVGPEAPIGGRYLESLSPEDLLALVPAEKLPFRLRGSQGVSPQSVRLCLYSPPKIGLELSNGGSRHILDLGNWEEVPRLAASEAQFGYFSLEKSLDELERKQRVDAFEKRVAFWSAVADAARVKELNVIDSDKFGSIVASSGVVIEGQTCKRIGQADCTPVDLTLEPQVNGKWCVPASMAMALTFKAHPFAQADIAGALGLGQRNSAITLAEGKEGLIEDFIDHQSGLDARLEAAPAWREIESALGKNEPVVSLIIGHARLVAGLSSLSLRLGEQTLEIFGLVVFDPWPQRQGRIVHWESLDAYKHRVIVPVGVAALSSNALSGAGWQRFMGSRVRALFPKTFRRGR